MNAAEKPVKDAGTTAFPNGVAATPARENESTVSGWSALMDGCIGADELDALFAHGADPGASERWELYQVVGDALRGSLPLTGGTPASTFLEGFQARLKAESASFPAAPERLVEAPLPLSSGRPQPTAANDATFRWKMVAMAASVSAVMAVSWSLLGNAFTQGTVSPGAVLASVESSAAPAAGDSAVAQQPTPTQVVVDTAQGPLIRDGRLEALLAEHRQYGGMSALQMPAGFLRNATYDAPER